MTTPKLLLMLPQSPFDPSSGAARSMRTICEMLVKRGWEVRCVCTTTTDAGAAPFPFQNPLHNFSFRGVLYRWEDGQFQGPQALNCIAHEAMYDFRPDVLFTFGGSSAQRFRMQQSRRLGIRVVFGLRNLEYMDASFFAENTDAVLTCSEFTRQRYLEKIGLESTAIPVPIDPEDCIAKERDPKYLTIVNPSREKGQLFIARFVNEMTVHHPEIPILIVESRGTHRQLDQYLSPQSLLSTNVIYRPMVQQPREWACDTCVLLVPSVWEEPAGRVIAEALLNGIPPIVSDRGALPEMCNGPGHVIALPKWYTPESTELLSTQDVAVWVNEARAMCAGSGYANRSAEAREAGKKYNYDTLADRYAEFFRKLL